MFTDFLQLCKRSSYVYFSYVYAEIAFSNVYAEVERAQVERADLCHTQNFNLLFTRIFN